MDTAHVEIDLGFFRLVWMLFLVRPRLSIDGVVETRRWGKHEVTLPAGRHVIEAWFPYLWPGKVCRGSITIELVADKSYKLRYRPTWLFVSGKMTVVEQVMLPAATVRQLP